MNELKSKTMEVIEQINTDWCKVLDEIQEYLQDIQKKGDTLDLSLMMSMLNGNGPMKSFVPQMRKLDQYFREAGDRVGGPKKKGFRGLF